MTYALMHIEDAEPAGEDWRQTDPYMDVDVLMPGGEKVVAIVPLGALSKFLPILGSVTEGREPQRCAECGEVLDVPHVERTTPPLVFDGIPF